jgi:hypothetical protein
MLSPGTLTDEELVKYALHPTAPRSQLVQELAQRLQERNNLIDTLKQRLAQTDG